jgi:hypothetical protein
MQQDVYRDYNINKQQQSNFKGKSSYDEYQEMLQQINYDIAWQIFDEVNQNNDTEQIIDLQCLDYLDAQAITK